MIENPPYVNDDFPSRELLQLLNNVDVLRNIVKINDEYLYWNDVKYRAQPLGISKGDLWSLVKYTRLGTDMKIDGFDGIHFSLSNSMQRRCHEFDMNFGGSWGTSKVFPEDKTTQELYLVSSIMEEAIASSQMEGAATTREVAKEMLRKRISPRDKGQRMIANNYNTINFIRDHSKEDLTPALIMQVHSLMTEGALDVEDAAGRFRMPGEKIVVGDGITGETVHTPPPAECLPDFIGQLCTFFNDKSPAVFIHPIIRGIIIHFLIGYYHPFADGNGRTARALFYWHMMKNDYWLVQYLSISRIIRGSKKAYEKAFLFAEHDSNDIGYFIQYHLDVLDKSFEELKKYLIRKHNEKKKSERLLHLGNITLRQAEILNRFIDNPDGIVTSVDIMNRFGVSPGTAKSDLRDLTEKGYLSEISLNGRTKGYIIANFDKLR
ncbi:MAG: Fic family protein [Clostridium sp.]|nr:Fic family protein [Bacteroides sp.]MCM1198792.1 Fic family protein [Clostridium sp.]